MDKEIVRKQLEAAGLTFEENGGLFKPLYIRGTLMLPDGWRRWQFERFDESLWVAYSEDHFIQEVVAEKLTELWPGIRYNQPVSGWSQTFPFVVDSAHPDSLANLVKVLEIIWIARYGDDK